MKKRRIGIFGLAPAIAAAIVLNKNTAEAPKNKPAEGGAGAVTGEGSDPLRIELDNALRDLAVVREDNKKLLADRERVSKELNDTLEEITRAPGAGSEAETSQLRTGAENMAKVIATLLPNEIKEDEGAFEIATRLLTEFAPTIKSVRAGTYAEKAPETPVEGGSAILTKKNGKAANDSIYVIGVSLERKEVCVYGTPPKLWPLEDVKPVKRGHPITGEEVLMRNNAFPGRTWDPRKD